MPVQSMLTKLPAGSLPPVTTLATGSHTLSIVGKESDGGVEGETEFGERWYIDLQYPDGFVRMHQVKTVEEITAKIVNQLRGRYGVDSVEFTAIPTELNVGETFTITI